MKAPGRVPTSAGSGGRSAGWRSRRGGRARSPAGQGTPPDAGSARPRKVGATSRRWA